MVSGLCAISSALIPSLKDFWLELILFEVSLKYMNARFFPQRFYCLRVGNDPIICRFVSLGQVILQADTLFRYFQFILEVFNGLLHGAFTVPFSLRYFVGRDWCRLFRGIFCSICRLFVGGVWGYAAIRPHH